MRDRILTYAIVISVLAHLGVVAVVGHTYASRLNQVPQLSKPKFINVDLIEPSKTEQAKPLQAPKVSAPKPVVVPPPPPPAPEKRLAADTRVRDPRSAALPSATQRSTISPSAHTRPSSDGAKQPGDPGGRLNTGTSSAHGDINVGPGGSTPVGWVPNNSGGSGKGSGTGSGVGTPDPPKQSDPGPGDRPAPAPPAPPPPPTPRMVSVEICSVSGLLPNKHCSKTHSKSFVEGNQPSRICTECKEPFKSTLADRAEPVLVRDSKIKVPSSVDEGLSLTVTVGFTINQDGNVTDASIISSSGHKQIDREAINAVQKRKYQPAIQGGVPRSVKRKLTYRINT